MVRPVVQTADGSITCFNDETGEHYHNKAGAFTEAKLNYVEPSGVIEAFCTNRKVSALDVPFGLGYNSLVFLQQLLALEVIGDAPGEIKLVGIESDANIVEFAQQVLDDARFEELRAAMFPDALESLKRLQPAKFYLQNTSVLIDVKHGDMRKILPQLKEQNYKFDAVWHDPFSPNKMPELWTADIFKTYRAMMPARGRVCTYSVSVTTRAGFIEAGFNVYGSLPVGDKSGGTVASVEKFADVPLDLKALTDAEVLRLTTKSGVPFRDPTFDATRAEIRTRRDSEQKNFI
jgi:tRNA U34 5-methylaminomethyl-2-thiouridine-forming methyltransferase MnmC